MPLVAKVVAIGGAMLAPLAAVGFAGAARHQRPHVRRPVSLATTAGSRMLFVANRRSGTISVVDPRAAAVVREVDVGRTLVDLAALPEREGFLAVDRKADRLLRVVPSGEKGLRVVDRVAVPVSPVAVRAAPGGPCWVASQWSRRLAEIRVAPRLRVKRRVDLPFAPRRLWSGRDGRLVVADAFGGTLAGVSTTPVRLTALRSIDGHNIRGLARAPDAPRLLIAHQILDASVPTKAARIRWGAVISNVVRSVELDRLFRSPETAEPRRPRPLDRWFLYALGRNGRGAADPGPMATRPGGTTVVALSGVGEVAIRDGRKDDFERLAVGRGPSAVEIDGDRAFVANRFSDSVTVVDLSASRVSRTIDLGPTPAPAPADRGEALFYDARLSLDGWYSCNSCHVDGHTNGLLNDNFTDGTASTPKRVLSLLGTGETAPWSWTGEHPDLVGQIRGSIRTTMRGEPNDASEDNGAAIAAYLKTLESPPSLREARGETASSAVERGRQAFDRLGCADCHTPPTYTSRGTFDVSGADSAGEEELNPPSLRGVSQRPSYFHDNRAASLRAVFEVHGHPNGTSYSEGTLDALIAFLESL